MSRKFTIIFLVSSFSFVQSLVASDNSSDAALLRCDKDIQTTNDVPLSAQSRAEFVRELNAQVAIADFLRKQGCKAQQQVNSLNEQVGLLAAECNNLVEQVRVLSAAREEQKRTIGGLEDKIEGQEGCIAARDARIEGQNDQIRNFRIQVDTRDAIIAELEGKLGIKQLVDAHNAGSNTGGVNLLAIMARR